VSDDGYHPDPDVLARVGLDAEADSPEVTLSEAAVDLANVDWSTLDWSTLEPAEIRRLFAARRNTPDYRAKAARLDAIPPSDAADRRRWEANADARHPGRIATD
jgi:hypothetical protein